MHAHGHKPRPFIPLRVAVITVSDTRTLDTDKSGKLAEDRLVEAGHQLVERVVIKDEIPAIQDQVMGYRVDDTADVVILTGGTGITRRDVTPDAIAPLATRHIPGFGELFRHLSFAEIGTSTIQSRADAWMLDHLLVFALPGSTGAVRLAMDDILIPQLDHRTRPCSFTEMIPRVREDGRWPLAPDNA
jgi:molybdenum cofactor biosynthesis protein B